MKEGSNERKEEKKKKDERMKDRKILRKTERMTD